MLCLCTGHVLDMYFVVKKNQTLNFTKADIYFTVPHIRDCSSSNVQIDIFAKASQLLGCSINKLQKKCSVKILKYYNANQNNYVVTDFTL